MPTFRIDGDALRFYASDGAEPPHVHVLRGGGVATVWLEPVCLPSARGYNDPEVNRVFALVKTNPRTLLETWHAYFGS